MSITLIGVFDDQDDARKASNKLEAAGIDKQSIRVEAGSTEIPAEQPQSRRSFFAELFGIGDDNDDTPGHYAEAVRRGSTVVTVTVADEQASDDLADILGDCGAIDVEERVEKWKAHGYSGYNESAPPYTPEQIAAERSDVLQVVQEDLKVGKRTVQRGGVRVSAGSPRNRSKNRSRCARSAWLSSARRSIGRPARPTCKASRIRRSSCARPLRKPWCRRWHAWSRRCVSARKQPSAPRRSATPCAASMSTSRTWKTGPSAVAAAPTGRSRRFCAATLGRSAVSSPALTPASNDARGCKRERSGSPFAIAGKRVSDQALNRKPHESVSDKKSRCLARRTPCRCCCSRRYGDGGMGRSQGAPCRAHTPARRSIRRHGRRSPSLRGARRRITRRVDSWQHRVARRFRGQRPHR